MKKSYFINLTESIVLVRIEYRIQVYNNCLEFE